MVQCVGTTWPCGRRSRSPMAWGWELMQGHTRPLGATGIRIGRSMAHGIALVASREPEAAVTAKLHRSGAMRYKRSVRASCRQRFVPWPAPTTRMDALRKLARKGPIRARDLDAAGIPRTYLKQLCDSGDLEQVDRGLYRLPDAEVTELHTLAEIGKRVPHGIICSRSSVGVGRAVRDAGAAGGRVHRR
jgi:Transcriptional regulator, AbiEi antitoxin